MNVGVPHIPVTSELLFLVFWCEKYGIREINFIEKASLFKPNRVWYLIMGRRGAPIIRGIKKCEIPSAGNRKYFSKTKKKYSDSLISRKEHGKK